MTRIFTAAPDMTDYDRIRELLRWAERSLDSGTRSLVLDLSDMDHADSSLVAGVVLVGRRAKDFQAKVHLLGCTQQFADLLEVYRVRSTLTAAGVTIDISDCAKVKSKSHKEAIEKHIDAEVVVRTTEHPDLQESVHTWSANANVST